jgi:hypothetical protein
VPSWLRHPRYAVHQLAGIPALSARYEPVRVRAAPLTDLHHLQGICRHVSRHQDRVKVRSENRNRALPPLSRYALHPKKQDS